MRLIVAVVGKPKHAALGAAIHDYEERARRYWPLQVLEVKDEPVRTAAYMLSISRVATVHRLRGIYA